MAVNFSQFKPFHQSPCVNQASFAFCQEFLYFSFLRVNVSISLTLLLTSNPCQFLVFCNIFRCRCYLEFNYVPHCFCFVNYSRHFFQSYFIFSLSHLSFPRVCSRLSLFTFNYPLYFVFPLFVLGFFITFSDVSILYSLPLSLPFSFTSPFTSGSLTSTCLFSLAFSQLFWSYPFLPHLILKSGISKIIFIIFVLLYWYHPHSHPDHFPAHVIGEEHPFLDTIFFPFIS